jgi:hypothetical protein
MVYGPLIVSFNLTQKDLKLAFLLRRVFISLLLTMNTCYRLKTIYPLPYVYDTPMLSPQLNGGFSFNAAKPKRFFYEEGRSDISDP